MKPRYFEPADIAAVDRAAAKQGFVSREPAAMRRKRPFAPVDEPMDQVNFRAPLSVINEFVAYCESEHCSYREGLARLLRIRRERG